MRPRYFAWTRQFTGSCVHRAYVRDRVSGNVLQRCSHQHRREIYATRCAEKMLRSFLRKRNENAPPASEMS